VAQNNKNLKSNNIFIKKIFAEVPDTYEIVNHILTLGLDIIWRKKAVRCAEKTHQGKWVDMCTGTGETAIYLKKNALKSTKVYAVDLTSEMMKIAKSKPEAKGIEFIEADVRALPFEDNSFDLITISFATRNLNLNRDILTKAFVEFNRVLKPGGLFVNLETSQPDIKLIKHCFHLYIKLFVRLLGSKISGSKQAYQYLSQTIPRFYSARELMTILYEAGFAKVGYETMLFGVAAIHQSYKKASVE
jgi:demethylmenaquinone methyltransferase / 2-methoxy-6-polyprenyl-1,4-benzoquinol methylase